MGLFNRLKTLAEAKGRQSFKEFSEQTLKDSCLDHVDGIAISDISFEKKSPETFLKVTKEALALIKSLDARRYRRICRHLNYIVNLELISGGNFDRRLNTCHVDFTRYLTSHHQEWNVRRYACLLVHEATHGVLEEKLILYIGDKRERIEGLCHLEEYRFAKHFESGWADTFIGPFQPDRWKLYWEGSLQDRLTAYWKRLTERRP